MAGTVAGRGKYPKLWLSKNHLFVSCGISTSEMFLDPILTSMAANHWNPKAPQDFMKLLGCSYIVIRTYWLSKTFSGHLKNMWVRFKLLPDLWSFHLSLDFHLERLPQIAMSDPLFGGVVFFWKQNTPKTTHDDASTSLALISCNCGL